MSKILLLLLNMAWAAANVATSCADLKDTCTSGCGAHAVFPDCKSHKASCTPYSFMPNESNHGCANWMDSAHSAAAGTTFSTKPFFLGNGGEFGYQAFQADGKDDIWIVHGCDGAGIQTDCVGDILYLERFGSTHSVTPQPCPPGTYGVDHIQCPTFYHQGLGVSFPDYTCGWWRGYKDAVGIEDASSDGVGAFGPAGSAGDYSASIRKALANCPTCDDGSGLKHPYAKAGAKAYFTGVVWPWICTATSESNPYTGSKDKCYCDNEPWNGRGSGAREYPQHTEVAYCGLFPDDKRTIKLVCDFVQLQAGSKATATRGVTLFPAAFPSEAAGREQSDSKGEGNNTVIDG